MIKKISMFMLALSGLLVFSLVSCEEDPEESCGFDEICEVELTYCCVDDDCTYKYNGKEYPDTDAGFEDLLDDMNCTTTAIGLKSAQENREEIRQRIMRLVEQVKAQQK